VYLPDGSPFETWEVPLSFSRTYYVAGSDPSASDNNPGSEDEPFRTIHRAAQVAAPGERVLIGSGVYREWVRPERGGSGPDAMISYEAAPGADVILKGSEVLEAAWEPSRPYRRPAGAEGADVWMVELPRGLFHGYNPFAAVNLPQMVWQLRAFRMTDELLPVLMLRRGLVFQEGRALRQVARYSDLFEREGAFWVEASGLVIHARPHDGADPNEQTIEVTAREQVFAPDRHGLGYIRVKGLTIEHAGDGFPVPQRAALSAMRGHHWIIEDCQVRWANALGIDVGRQDWNMEPPEPHGHHIVRRNTVSCCGVCGICGIGPIDHSRIEDNIILGCCWQNVEDYFEAAAIKTHRNRNVLLRRNVILDTKGGAGIWLDYLNANTRCTQNVILGTQSRFGGIFVEASHEPNMIDHNLIWDTDGSGVYEHDTDKLIVAHNMIGQTRGAAVCLELGNVRRWVGGRGAAARKHRVVNNILVDNDRMIEFANADNVSDHNLFCRSRDPGPFRIHQPQENLDLAAWQEFHGWDLHSAECDVRAELDAESLELTWSVAGDVPACSPVAGVSEDFCGEARHERFVVPGPFAEIPDTPRRVNVDPRVSPEAD
jgi:hypothetical protein